MADIDWDAVKVAYITGNISLKKLAKDRGISENTLESRSRKGKWGEEKRKYHGKVTAKAQARIQAREADRLEKLQDAGTKLCDVLEKLMKDAYREVHLRVDAFGNEIVTKGVNDKKLLNISKTIDTMSRAMRNLYDIPTKAEKAQTEAHKAQTKATLAKTTAADKTVNEIEITYTGVEGMEAYHD